jgi:hypothetical protein
MSELAYVTMCPMGVGGLRHHQQTTNITNRRVTIKGSKVIDDR